MLGGRVCAPVGFDVPAAAAFLTTLFTVEVSVSFDGTAAGGFISRFDFAPAVSVVAAEGVTDGAATPAACGAAGALAAGERDAGAALAADAEAAVEALAAEVTVVGSVAAEVEVCWELSVAVVPD